MMETKSKLNRFAAVFLALAMLLTLIPFSSIARAEEAASGSGSSNVYTFDAPKEIAKFDAGAKKDGESETFNDIFTVYYSAKTKIDGTAKTFDDDYSADTRLNFGAAMDITTPKNVVALKADGAGTLKLWWASNGDTRPVVVKNAAGEIVAQTKCVAKNSLAIDDKLEIPAAGTYFIGSEGGASYLYKFEFTKEVAATTYTFDAPKEIAKFDAGDKKDGESETFNDIFTVYYSAKTKIDGSAKTFDDDYSADTRLNFGAAMDITTPKNVVAIKADGAGTLKLWWASNGDTRPVVVKNAAGEIVAQTKCVAKNSLAIDDNLEIPAAGIYYVGSEGGASYLYKFEVTIGAAAPIARGDWSKVEAPVITKAEQASGNINVTVSAVIGNDGGDKLVVDMLDKDGKVVETKQSLAEKSEHTLTFAPKTSGTYTFKATLSREEETDKAAAKDGTCEFLLPLGTPTIASATSMGSGKMALVWTAVDEAEKYIVYVDGKKAGESKTTAYTVSDLKVGSKPAFTVSAVRGTEEGKQSDAFSATVTADEQRVWSYTIYGTSTNATDGSNGYTGNLNEDGKVTVFSENGKGKLESGAVDGIMFYYTAIPANQNFTLRAKMHLDKWTFSNGQEAIGLLASDSIPAVMSTDPYWTNNYYLTLGTVAYNWDATKGEVVDHESDAKYDMRCGLGVYPNLGVTKENQDKINTLGLAATVDPNIQYPLDLTAAIKGLDGGRYNIAGNVTNAGSAPTTIAEIVDFDIEIQRNNTGYFFTYYDSNGKVVGQQKFYETDALCKVDEDNVYVGFFAARNARATFSDVELTTIDPKDDKPAEARPTTYVVPAANITSASVANSPDYKLMFTPNVKGTVTITVNGETIVSNVAANAKELFSKAVSLSTGSNKIKVEFTPAPNDQQGFDEYTKLENTDTVTSEITVKYNINFAAQNNLYVDPNGTSAGNGSPEYPLDIYTAVKVVQPGQTIVIMEGTYKLENTLRIERGVNGTADKMIKMIADPEAKTRPVFDFCSTGSGIRHGGDYWYFSGFDVTNGADKASGFRVCGNNNTVDQVNLYNNGGTGLQISAFRDSSDPQELWPKNNLILNCTSYNNADKGYEDADGFAAKLTVGEGNVFDGCVAYNNADDGWDLFARASSGRISPVTIRNCVAYKNGVLLDGTKAGNGNGFKLGGGNLPGGHKLINSIAFDNMADGITSNSCPDVQVINCTSYNNGKSNLNLYTNDKANTTSFVVEGLVSCNGAAADAIKKNTTDTSTIKEETNKVVTADAFVSTTFDKLERNADGTIKLGDFLKLKDATGSGADFDAEGGSTPSKDVTVITPDKEDDLATVFEDNDSKIQVTAPVGAFENVNDITFNADPVPGETDDKKFTFDLNFTDKDGNKVQPNVPVIVSIPVPEALKDKTIYVYHVDGKDKYTEISCSVESGMVVFTASKFSNYVLTSEKIADSNPITGFAPFIGLTVLAGAVAAACVIKNKRNR